MKPFKRHLSFFITTIILYSIIFSGSTFQKLNSDKQMGSLYQKNNVEIYSVEKVDWVSETLF